MQLDTGSFYHTETVAQDSNGEAVEIGKYRDVTVQIVRSGTTATATVQVSNDGAVWATAHSRRVDTNDHVALSSLSAGVETLLERARYVRLSAGAGSTDSFEFIVSAPSARG